jgi:lipopolysaccharide/colanic/teichoic acid biosynthesis glycosyltransferase
MSTATNTVAIGAEPDATFTAVEIDKSQPANWIMSSSLALPADQLPSMTIDASRILPTETFTPRSDRAYIIAKRMFDVAFALVLLVLLSPVWITAALLVGITSPGPILFRQQRVGEHGQLFTCLKLRTMIPDAHSQKVELIDLNDTTGPVFKLRMDPRVFPIGRWLRKLSIDELPQLINVVRGEMSIVGPRPPLSEEVEKYTAHHRGRLTVKPGLTCLWQVSGRSHIGFEEWVALDLEYIQRRGFWFDLWLILLTIPAVLTARGAF